MQRKSRRIPPNQWSYDEKDEIEKQFATDKEGTGFGEFTTRHKVILSFFALAFVVMIFGVIPWEDLGSAHSHLVVVVPRDDRQFPVLRHPDRPDRPVVGEGTVNTFVDGARDMLGVALIIGVARGITVIMNNGLIIDTVLYWAEQATGRVERRRLSSSSPTCCISRFPS